MDAVVGTLKFENKAVIPTDPRTKLFLTVTVSRFSCTGVSNNTGVLQSAPGLIPD